MENQIDGSDSFEGSFSSVSCAFCLMGCFNDKMFISTVCFKEVKNNTSEGFMSGMTNSIWGMKLIVMTRRCFAEERDRPSYLVGIRESAEGDDGDESDDEGSRDRVWAKIEQQLLALSEKASRGGIFPEEQRTGTCKRPGETCQSH